MPPIQNKSPFALNSDGNYRGVLADMRFAPGNVFFVDSTSTNKGDTPGRGATPEAPYATIDYAIGQCEANNGDMIIVMPGHTETITAAGGIDADVAGISIIGIGNGRLRPTINFTTAVTADFDIDAANITIENLFFDLTGIDSLDGGIDVNAADFTLRNCEIEIADATGQADAAIVFDNNANRMTIENCFFHGAGDVTPGVAIDGVGANNVTIRNNRFIGYFGTVGAIRQQTTAGVNWVIDSNVIQNRTADGDNKTIILVATTVGMISNNRMSIIDSTTPTPLTAAAAFVSGNYSTGAAGVAASTLI